MYDFSVLHIFLKNERGIILIASIHSCHLITDGEAAFHNFRSKSTHQRVTNIQHGGPITFVSVNNANLSSSRSPEDSGSKSEIFQGSHTLPRSGAAKSKKAQTKQKTVDDSEVIITRRLSSGGNSVRIQIGAGHPGRLDSSKLEQQDKIAAQKGNPKKPKRKYTLEELEVEGFEPSTSESEGKRSASMSEDELFDLNSLIEGAVDDDEDTAEYHSALEDNSRSSATASAEVSNRSKMSEHYFKPVQNSSSSSDARSVGSGTSSRTTGSKGRIQRVDSLSSEEEELLSMAVNHGSLPSHQLHQHHPHLQIAHPRDSDTEADFLDRVSTSTTNTSGSVNSVLRREHRATASPASSSSSSKPSSSSSSRRLLPDKPRAPPLGQLSQHLSSSHNSSSNDVRGTSIATETSDFDSVSTTSASYTVNHSDLDSLLNDETVDRSEGAASSQNGTTNNVVLVADQDSPSQGQAIALPNMQEPQPETPARPGQLRGSQSSGSSKSESSIGDSPPTPSTALAHAQGKEGAEAKKRRHAHEQEEVRSKARDPEEVTAYVDTQEARDNEENKNNTKSSETSSNKAPPLPVAAPRNVVAPVSGKKPQGGKEETTKERKENAPTKLSEDNADLVEQPPLQQGKRKGSVSSLIAKFETPKSVGELRTTRSVTPDRSSRSLTPDTRPASAAANLNSASSNISSSTGAVSKRAKSVEPLKEETEKEKQAEIEQKEISEPKEKPKAEKSEVQQIEPEPSKPSSENDDFGKGSGHGENDPEENLPLGAEAINPELVVDEENLENLTEEEMKTLRGQRNNSGGYTSYVFISSDPARDEVSSVVSSSSSTVRAGAAGPEGNRVVVNVKEPGSNCVVLQDGRASNISIVSTESSDLGSPNSPIQDEELYNHAVAPPPELPAKIRARNGQGVIDLQHHFVHEQDRTYLGRTRGGEPTDEHHFLDREETTPEDESVSRSPSTDTQQANGGALANYFTSSLEASSSSSSRRGRPPVIRAADRAARSRQQQQSQYEGEDDLIDEEYDVDEQGNPIHYEMERRERGDRGGEEFRITEMVSDPEMYEEVYSDEADYHRHDYDPQVHYDVRYESGDSVEGEDEEYIDNQEYPMCQPVYDDSQEEYSEGEQLSSGDEYFDREEELRGYNRQIDFTLHTIIEESCEDSESEPRSMEQASGQRQSDPSELEKYFFYGVGGGNRDEEFSDTYSETSLNTTGNLEDEADESLQAEEMASNRYEKYFMSGKAQPPPSGPQQLSLNSDRNTDDSGSVGSESDGQRSPVNGDKKKRVLRSKVRNSDRGESGGDNAGDDSSEHRPTEMNSYSSGSSDDNSAFLSGDGQYDTVKRKKNKARRPNGSDGERSADSRRPSATSEQILKSVTEETKKDSSSPKVSPPITPLPSQIIEVQPATTSSSSPAISESGASPLGSEKEFELSKKQTGTAAGTGSGAGTLQQNVFGSKINRESPSTSPPANGPVRKHKSRDSGFVGSTDDLLRSEGAVSGSVHTSSDSTQSLSEGENQQQQQQTQKRLLEKVSEVSENTEDDSEKSINDKSVVAAPVSLGSKSSQGQVPSGSGFKVIRTSSSEGSAEDQRKNPLARKDSFQNWSSDEDTNIMMNRMRTFFKGLLAGYGHKTDAASATAGPSESEQKKEEKPAQLVAFEEQLTRLMRTVPGINEEQVKEIVEYLSSEDTWSDSYDSSDYTSSDLEGAYAGFEPVIPDLDMSAEIQEQISASCQEIIQKFDATSSADSSLPSQSNDDFQKETALMYSKLMAKMQQNQQEKETLQKKKSAEMESPPIAAKVMHHISTRLVALMHEVTASDGNSSSASLTNETNFADRRYIGPPTRRYRRGSDSNSSSSQILQLKSSGSSDKSSLTSFDEESGSELITKKTKGKRKSPSSSSGQPAAASNDAEYTFESLDSPKVLMGPNLKGGDVGEDESSSSKDSSNNSFKFSKASSKSVEILDTGRRKSLDDKSLKLGGGLMAKSTSTEYDVWQGSHHGAEAGAPPGGMVAHNSQRRGSLGHVKTQLESLQSHSSSSGVSDIVNDDERWSWKGSFESALAMDSQSTRSSSSRLAAADSKRRSIASAESSSGEQQVDNGKQHSASSGLVNPNRSSSSSQRSKWVPPGSRLAPSAASAINQSSDSVPSSEASSRRSNVGAAPAMGNFNSDSESESNAHQLSSRFQPIRRGSVPAESSTTLPRDSSNPAKQQQQQYQHHQDHQLQSVRQHSTNSLPRLGTSAIKKTRAVPVIASSANTSSTSSSGGGGPPHQSQIMTSTATVTLAGSLSAGPRSARYRPPGYKPVSSSTSCASALVANKKLGGAAGSGVDLRSRKPSVESLQGRYYGKC